jgi:hypothetical protein
MKCLIIGGITNDHSTENNERLVSACLKIGKFLAVSGHSLTVCSPFKDSADYWVLKGFVEGEPKESQLVQFYFVDSAHVNSEIEVLKKDLNFSNFIKVPYPAPNSENPESLSYSWLLCQLQALETCQIIVAIGGKVDGVANMLLLLAESKNKLILPLSFLGGAAGLLFHRIRYELSDKLGDDYLKLQDENNIDISIDLLTRLSVHGHSNHKKGQENKSESFFISYPRKRPHEADYIETLLRRRNKKVFRDDSDFGAGSSIPSQIREAIHSANVFIATWCQEYACSPWCFDEIELAFNRFDSGDMKIWIFCLDDTRMVPIRSRNCVTYSVNTREAIEGQLLSLLEK